ncbi:DUF397 domain-containing protein [Yinghuangia seranimata]|nr:DUF397 domain-containing protein [Yinghuangia seranimata]MDI2125182.1 DUF397 domain-containing protein [Yinghuangia seranimata]
MAWHRSSYSGGANNCVEAAPDAAFVHVRDSKSVRGPVLSLTPAAWGEFLTDVGAGTPAR